MKLDPEQYDLYSHSQEKIVQDGLENDLDQYIAKFGPYGQRMVFKVLHHLSKEDQLHQEEINNWLDGESIESIDFILLLYALEFPENCRDYVQANLKKIVDHPSHTFRINTHLIMGKFRVS